MAALPLIGAGVGYAMGGTTGALIGSVGGTILGGMMGGSGGGGSRATPSAAIPPAALAQVTAPAPSMPSADQGAVAERARANQVQAQRRGRLSTILTARGGGTQDEDIELLGGL